MNKLKSVVLDIWTAHFFIIVRMAIVYYLIIWFLSIYNEIEFDWSKEARLTLGYTFLFWLIYCIATAMDYSRFQSSPFIVASEIQKQISIHLTRDCRTKKDARGLFRMEVKFSKDENKLIHLYHPIENPLEVINKIDAFIIVLNTINTQSADEQVEKLNKYRDEAEYMVMNIIDVIVESHAM